MSLGRARLRIAAVAVVILLCRASESRAGEEDSPWPDSDSTAVQIAATRSEIEKLEDQSELMELSVARYDAWQSCLRGVPVTEYGDPDRQFGFLYDERDGSGRSFMPALAVDRTRRDGDEDYLFLDFGRAGGCRSNAPLPGGTADPARARVATVTQAPAPAWAHASAAGGRAGVVRDLERRVTRLKRVARRLEAASERFDTWESCVSWVPVTEYGDPDGGFGFEFQPGGAASPIYRPALAIDRSDWDDPDYMFLALVGGDRPGRECQDEPGEGDD
jgi:hypothetical protein